MYIEVMVIPVKSDRLSEYKKMARISAKLFKQHGALTYIEALAEDVKPGKSTSFPQSVKLKDDEVVATVIATFKSRAARNGAWKKMMQDPFFSELNVKNAPFDMKRMFFGGFKSIASF